MLPSDLERIRENVEKATDEDLLDRATVYRQEMEPLALDIIENELVERGIMSDDIAEHAERRADALRFPDGRVQICSSCRRPAVAQGWGWRKMRDARGIGMLLWWLPIPWFYRYCEEHKPADPVTS